MGNDATNACLAMNKLCSVLRVNHVEGLFTACSYNSRALDGAEMATDRRFIHGRTF